MSIGALTAADTNKGQVLFVHGKAIYVCATILGSEAQRKNLFPLPARDRASTGQSDDSDASPTASGWLLLCDGLLLASSLASVLGIESSRSLKAGYCTVGRRQVKRHE